MKRSWLAWCAALCASCGGAAENDPAVIEGPPPGLTATGSFTLSSRIDLTVNNVLPAPVADYVAVLRELRDDPGQAFFDLLDDAGVPLLDELRAALPDSIEHKLGDWIGEAISDQFRDQIDAILDISDSALTRFDLLTELDLPAPDAAGHARATHTLRGLRFDVAGRAVEIPTPVSIAVAADMTLARGENGADARLLLGPHAFGLPYGELAYALLEAAALERFGGNMRETLGALANCPAVAAEVAGKCVLSVCVGHRSELEALCERGLDEAFSALRERLAGLRFDALRLAHGDATLWDTRLDGGFRDGTLDRIAGGVWQATLDLGSGPRSTPAIFSGERR